MEPVMLSFLEPTEKQKVKNQNLRKRQEIAIRNFSIRNNKRVELSYPENRRIEHRLEKGRLFERNRVNIQWKRGQLKCPNGSCRNFDS